MRPDICYWVQLLALFSSKVNRIAAAGLTHLLQYCYNTRFQKLILEDHKALARGFSDSDYGGDRLTRRSVAAFILFLGWGPIDWRSKQHKYVALGRVYLSGWGSAGAGGAQMAAHRDWHRGNHCRGTPSSSADLSQP
jgi:hypothetical protein